MTLPGQTLNILDPGLGLSSVSGAAFPLLGVAQKGSTTEVKAFSTPKQVEDEYGDGPLTQLACLILLLAGGPVYTCRLAGSVAGTNGSVTKTAAASSTGTITLAGAPYDYYQARLEIVSTGTLGTATFRYSLDNGRTYSQAITVPSGGTYLIPHTNITVTFVPGAGAVFFEAGDVHTWTSVAPHYTSTELATAVTAINAYLSTTTGFAFDAPVLAGKNATGAGAATLFGALAVHMAAFENSYRYMRAIMDGGSGDTTTNAKAAFASVTSSRIAIAYGEAVQASAKPFAGYGAPLMPAVNVMAVRAAAALISTDLGRVADGALTGVTAVTHDEYLTPEMDDARFSTLRTFPLEQGYFITNMRLKSAVGSDFEYWQHGRMMDVACRTVVLAQNKFVNSGFDTKADGTIAAFEAKRLNGIVTSKLAVQLLDPQNVEGKKGHVSALKYAVDETTNFLATNTLASSVGIRPKGYAKFITTSIGYTANV